MGNMLYSHTLDLHEIWYLPYSLDNKIFIIFYKNKEKCYNHVVKSYHIRGAHNLKRFGASYIVIIGLILFFMDSTSLLAQDNNICNTIANLERPQVILDESFYEAQLVSYDDAIAASPNDFELLTLRGDSHYGLGNFDNAISDYMQALANNPTATYTLSRLGDAYQQIFEIELAIDAYSQAIAIDSNYSYPYIKRAIAYRKIGDASQLESNAIVYQNSLDDFNTAIRIDGSSALAFARRSELFLSFKNYEQSLLDAQNAVNIGSEFTFAHTVIANLYKGNADFASAFASIRTALNTPTDNDDGYAYAYTMAGEMCWRMGERDFGLELLSIAQDYDNTFSATDIVYARVMTDLRKEFVIPRNIDEAENASGEVDSVYHFMHSERFLDQFYLLSAIESYILAAEHNPTNPFVFNQLQYLPVDVSYYSDDLAVFNRWQELAASFEENVSEDNDSGSD